MKYVEIIMLLAVCIAGIAAMEIYFVDNYIHSAYTKAVHLPGSSDE